MKNEILIYNDEGAGKDSVFHLRNCMEYIFARNHKINLVNAKQILNNNWQDSCRILCFGGGYDLGFLNRLSLRGSEIIRNFVLGGGIYIGICAGAYFASNFIEFDKNGPLEVVGERNLKFFHGTASGPIFPGFEYNTRRGLHACSIYGTGKAANRLRVMYEGGCMFNDCVSSENISMLYKYEINDEAAIIHTKCGKGQALLSGVHYEYNVDEITFDLNPDARYHLENAREDRLMLIQHLFKDFVIH